MRLGHFTAALMSSAAFLGMAAPVYAQTESGASDRAADDIIVTARRTEERLQDVPISIAVFNQERLDELNVVTANDLATFTPSLTSNARYGDETSKFAIRGFTQENQTAPSVAVYFADVTAPRAQGGTDGGNGAGAGAFFDLQNAQVLRGPQGTLFGRNTTGGAILLVPRRPSDEFEGYLEASAGDYNMARLQGVVNAPLTDNFRVRFGFDRQVRDGYLNNRSGIGPSELANTDYLALRLSAVAQITPTLENYTIVSYSNSQTDGGVTTVVTTDTNANCEYNVVPGAPPSAAILLGPLVCLNNIARAEAGNYGFWDVENNNPFPRLDIRQFQAINTTTWDITDSLTVKNILSYSEFQQWQNTSLFGDNITLPTSGGPLGGFGGGRRFAFVGLYAEPGRANIQQRTMTEEVQFQGDAGRLQYQFGAYYERSEPLHGYQGSLSPIFMECANVFTLTCDDVIGQGFIQNSLTQYEFENTGLYAQGTYAFTDQWALTLGARYTTDEVTATTATRTIYADARPAVCARDTTILAPTPEACALQQSQESEEPTWLINVDYRPTEDVLLYAKYARGYRQGGINASNTFPNLWDPEQVDAYEIGAKTSWDGDIPGTFNVAVFYNDFQAMQLAANLTPDGSVPNASPAQAIVNAGQSEISGLELEANISPFEGLRLTLGYTYLDTQLLSYSAPGIPGYIVTAPVAVGGQLSLAPEHKAVLTAAYTLPLDESIGEITGSVTYVHTAEQVSQEGSPIGILPASDIINLNLNWRSFLGSPVDLAAFATNVTEEETVNFVSGTFNTSGFDGYVVGQPRMYGVRLRYRFGAEN